jgi:hypothetical protein
MTVMSDPDGLPLSPRAAVSRPNEPGGLILIKAGGGRSPDKFCVLAGKDLSPNGTTQHGVYDDPHESPDLW